MFVSSSKDHVRVSTCIQQTRGRRQNPTNPREVDILGRS